MAVQISYSRIGFLLSCFLLPGLIGTFASFSIPAPVVDAMHQEAALDAVLTAPNPAAQQTALANLQNATDPDTAALATNGPAPLPARIAVARANMHREVVQQARDEAYKVRLMVITMTIFAALIGVALLSPGRAHTA